MRFEEFKARFPSRIGLRSYELLSIMVSQMKDSSDPLPEHSDGIKGATPVHVRQSPPGEERAVVAAVDS